MAKAEVGALQEGWGVENIGHLEGSQCWRV